jgi:PleD family two-component response regulator
MPRMHGYELIAEVRSGSKTKGIPIIVLTSRAGDKHASKAHELGANDYIIKPVDEESLLQSVRTLLASQGVEIGK